MSVPFEQKQIAELLVSLAKKYNCKEFIADDPVQFPHLYSDKRDIEISALVSSWAAYGNRKQILITLEKLHNEFSGRPFEYISQRKFEPYRSNTDCLYRFYTWQDYYRLCDKLYAIYVKQNFLSLEDKLLSINPQYTSAESLLKSFISLFPSQKGIPKNTQSACKRLCLLFRWLIRKDGIVDLGIWDLLPQSELIIPLDTHVFRLSKQLGLTCRKQADMTTALQITEQLRKIFPADPTLGDFALFGFGIDSK